MKYFFLLVLLVTTTTQAQHFTRQDSLRGSITPERAWWDLKHYHLAVEVFPKTKSIQGTNIITYEVLQKEQVLQLDLQAPMTINKVLQNNTPLEIKKDGNAHFIQLKQKQKRGKEYQLTVYFSGTPKEAVNPPWDGGFTWRKDRNGHPFIATSNQGIGASIWWPNKDHPYDEPDQGVDITITAPSHLVAVGNGRLLSEKEDKDTKSWHWRVTNPINNYGVNINIGDYVNFSEKYEGLKGTLDMDYWVLRDNLEKAKQQFKQAPMTIEAFEHWFGPYPFYEDSFKLVEVPYLGMEHQSSVTYGNGYKNGYRESDLSNTGWGLKFDFIIVHETGHEWFANNITNDDVADMWVHEGFTAYSENLYLNYHFNEEAASQYVIGTRNLIQNDRPIIGNYQVHHEGSSDMYYKGANILHTVRQIINDDEKWRAILKGLNEEFYHQTVSSKQIENYINTKSGVDLSSFWDQYLRTTQIPLFQYEILDKHIRYRFTNCIDNFTIPLLINVDDQQIWLKPTKEWQLKPLTNSIQKLEIKDDFYIDSEKVAN